MKNGGKGLISIQGHVRIERTSLGFYLKEKEQLLTEVVIKGEISDDENSKDVKQHKENYSQKRMHSAFMRSTEKVKEMRVSL